MSFISLPFLLFFPLVAVIWFMLPHKLKWAFLLLAGVVFYGFTVPAYLIIIFAVIVINYFAGIGIEKDNGRKRWLWLSIILTLGILVFFKYFNFFNANFVALAERLHLNYPEAVINIILPVGLSFYSFMAIAYVLEISRGTIKAERNPAYFSLYLMFFPVMIAGPIERPQNLLPQFREKHVFEYTRVVSGLRQMLWGFFKKVVMADNLVLLVNATYGNMDEQNGISLLAGTFFFAFQVYFDFSAYSDIAIGGAKVLGFRLTENFNAPYYSPSVTEFWRRWHISLFTWLRDYLFIPMSVRWRGMGLFGASTAIMLTFIICGIWHGASWTFVIWGALHGLYLMSENIISNLRRKKNGRAERSGWRKVTGIVLTFILTAFAWVFFRADTPGQALMVIKRIIVETPANALAMLRGTSVSGGFGSISHSTILILSTGVIFIYILEGLMKKPEALWLFLSHGWLRMCVYLLLFFAIIFLGKYGDTVFIYAQF